MAFTKEAAVERARQDLQRALPSLQAISVRLVLMMRISRTWR